MVVVMILNLIRYAYTPDETLGLLKFPVLDGVAKYNLWTVECPWLDNTPFASCIPDGEYSLQAFDSPKHPDAWVITPVPGRPGILFHVGNHAGDVTGCVCPGMNRQGTNVLHSADAMRLLNYVLDRNVQHQIVIGPGLGARLPVDERGDENDG